MFFATYVWYSCSSILAQVANAASVECGGFFLRRWHVIHSRWTPRAFPARSGAHSSNGPLRQFVTSYTELPKWQPRHWLQRPRPPLLTSCTRPAPQCRSMCRSIGELLAAHGLGLYSVFSLSGLAACSFTRGQRRYSFAPLHPHLHTHLAFALCTHTGG